MDVADGIPNRHVHSRTDLISFTQLFILHGHQSRCTVGLTVDPVSALFHFSVEIEEEIKGVKRDLTFD